MRTDASVTQMGLDIHRKFSKVTARDGQGKIAWPIPGAADRAPGRWKKQVDYTAAPPPRAGRRRRGHRRSHQAVVAKAALPRATSRPELGQPETPLAAAAVVGRLQADK